MPTALELLRARQAASTASRLGGAGGSSALALLRQRQSRSDSRRREPPTTEELKLRAQELEAVNREFGAREIEQDKPGAFARIVDILSRPNYAIAGFAEELFGEDRSVANGVKRALSEIFSGVGPIQGQKRAFGEVLENLGVGTVTLADAFPALEGTWVGAMGSRGAAGLALDIATDPLTYVTFGASGVRFGFNAGEKALSKAGNLRQLAIRAEQRAAGLVDEAADKAARDIFEREVFDEAGNILRPDYLDPGGMRFAGLRVPGTPGIHKRLGSKLVNAVKAVPGGELAIAGAVTFGNGLADMAGGLFNPGGPLRHLPPGMRSTAIRLKRKAEASNTAMKARLQAQAAEIDKEFKALLKKGDDPLKLGERMYSWREGTLVGDLTPAEKAVAERISKLYDSMYFDAHQVGLLDEDQMKLGYFLHRYENPPEDFLQVWTGMKGKQTGESIFPQHTKGRVFDTHGGPRGSIAMSEHLNKISLDMRAAGLNVPVYPVLKPDYDIIKNLKFYVDSHVDMVTRKAWTEEAMEIFKQSVDEFDLDAIYDLHKPGLSVVPRGELLREVDELQSLVNRAKARPGTVIAPLGDIAPPPPGAVRGFHGTVSESPFKTVSKDTPAFFSDDPRVASTYAGSRMDRVRGEVVQADVQLKKPLTVDGKGRHIDEVRERAIRQAKKNGNDGVIFENVIDNNDPFGGISHGPSTVYAVFNKRSFKRATRSVEPEVDTLTLPGRPAPLSDVAPTSAVVHSSLSRRKEIELLKRDIANPDFGLSKKELKEIAELTGEEADEFRRARAFRQKEMRERLRELQEVEREDFLQYGRALTKEEVPAAEARLKDLRERLHSPEVSDQHIIDLFFDGGKLKSLRKVEREFADVPGEAKPPKGTFDQKVVDDINRTMGRLKTAAGKREMMRNVYIRAKSPSQWAGIVKQLDSKWDEFLPEVRAVKPGSLEPTLSFYGEKAAYGIRSGGMWGEKPIMIPEIIAEGIENANSKIFNTKDYKEFGKLLRGFDRANNWFKLGVYTFWPASLVRDAYSNIALSMLDIGVGAIDPKLHMDTIMVMAGRKGSFRVTDGIIYDYENLRKMAKEMGVWVPGEVFVEATGEGIGIGRKLKKLASKRALIENEARMQLWMGNIRRGMTPRDAADRVGEFLFNYGEVSQVEREVFRRLIPFYTFTRKNIELQWKTLRRTPGLQINQIKPFRQRNSESESMVKYEAEGMAIRLDRDGKTVHMLTGIDLPLRNIDTLWKGGVGSTGRAMMGMLTPVLKTIPEILLDKDFFTNRLQERTTSGAVGRVIESIGPKPVKDWLGYAKEFDEAGRPKYTFDGQRFTLLFRSWMFSRLVSTSDRQFREYLGNGDWASALLDVATGIRNKEINLDEQARRKLQIRIRQLEEAQRRRGLARGFTRTFTPRQEIDLR